MNLIPVIWVDVWPLSVSLRRRLRLFGGDGPLKAILWPVEGDEWPAARAMIRRIQNLDPNAEHGYIAFEMLSPGGIVQWSTELDRGWRRAHLPIVTNPGAMMYSGPHANHLSEGQLTLVNQQVPCSQANFGGSLRIHLVIDFRPRLPPLSEQEVPV